jgi:hypothetical protein
MCSATHRGRGCSKFPAAAKRRGGREFWRPTTPRQQRFLKKEKKEMCGTRFRPIRCEARRDPDQQVEGSGGIGWEEDILVLVLAWLWLVFSGPGEQSNAYGDDD